MQDHQPDGRRLRRDRNRNAVLDAFIRLVESGNEAPTTAEVADLAGVSHRSVFRYFDDADDLFLQGMLTAAKRYASLTTIPNFGQGTFAQRTNNLVDQRIAMHQGVAPLARASLQRQDLHVQFREQLQPGSFMRAQIETQFAPELSQLAADDQKLAISALDAMLSFQSYDVMANAGQSGDDIADVYRFAIRSLLL